MKGVDIKLFSWTMILLGSPGKRGCLFFMSVPTDSVQDLLSHGTPGLALVPSCELNMCPYGFWHHAFYVFLTSRVDTSLVRFCMIQSSIS